MHFLDHIQGTLSSQRLGQQGLEVIGLLRSRHLRFHVESRFQECLMGIAAVPAEEKHGVYVGGAAFIKREEEAQLRIAGQPLRDALVENAVRGNIPQRRLFLFDRADGAENIAECAVGVFIIDFFVHIALPDINIIIQHEDQPVFRVLRIFHGLHIRMLRADAGDQPGKDILQHGFIRQRGIPCAEQDIVRFRRERDGRKRLADLSGQDFPEDGHIPLVFLFIEGGNSQLETGDEIADMVHIAAADYGRVALGWIQPPPEFR